MNQQRDRLTIPQTYFPTSLFHSSPHSCVGHVTLELYQFLSRRDRDPRSRVRHMKFEFGLFSVVIKKKKSGVIVFQLKYEIQTKGVATLIVPPPLSLSSCSSAVLLVLLFHCPRAFWFISTLFRHVGELQRYSALHCAGQWVHLKSACAALFRKLVLELGREKALRKNRVRGDMEIQYIYSLEYCMRVKKSQDKCYHFKRRLILIHTL